MSQFYPVILQIGSRIIQAGFAGDSYPVVRKESSDYDLAELNSSTHSHAVPQEITIPTGTDGYSEKVLWPYDLINNDEKQLENVLERIVHDLYTNYLLVDAKRCKVLVIEPPFFPTPLKKVITKVLLFHMHAQSISFYPEPLMSCVSSGSASGLVIDLGWNQTTISPVYDLRVIYNQAKTTNRSGRAIHKCLYKLLTDAKVLPELDVFDFVERLIFEASYSRASEQLTDDDKVFDFDGTAIPNRLRYESLESVLFGRNDEGSDDDTRPIATLVRSSLQELNIDLRGDLSKRIIITGGISKIPGVKSRLLQEITKELAGTALSIKSIVSLGPWEGASLYCSTSLMSPSSTGGHQGKLNELQRDKYLSGEAQMVDWIDEVYNVN